MGSPSIIATAVKVLVSEARRYAWSHWPRRPSKQRPPLPPIVFQAYAVHLAQFFTPVVHALVARNISVGFQILYHPHFSREERRRLHQFAVQVLGLPPEAIVRPEDSPHDPIQLLVCADVYARFPGNVATTCLMQHGVGLPDRHFRRFPLRKTVFQFDKFLVHGRNDHALVKQLQPPTQRGFEVLAAGCPFFDGLVEPGQDRTTYLSERGLNPDQPTVLIAPSWRGLTLMSAHGTHYFEDIMSELKGRSLNILVKLHACSYNKQLSGGIDWRKALQESRQKYAFAVDDHMDDRPALTHADLLITDISSRAVVFMALAKPVVQWFPGVLENNSWDQKRVDLIVKASLCAHEPSDVARHVDHFATRGFRYPDSLPFARDCISRFGESTDYVVEQMLSWVSAGSDCAKP